MLLNFKIIIIIIIILLIIIFDCVVHVCGCQVEFLLTIYFLDNSLWVKDSCLFLVLRALPPSPTSNSNAMSIMKLKKCRIFPHCSSYLWDRLLWLSWAFLSSPGPSSAHLLPYGAGQGPNLVTAVDWPEHKHWFLHHFKEKFLLKYWALFCYWLFKIKTFIKRDSIETSQRAAKFRRNK